MRSQPNSSSFYISAALCGVPCTRILDDVSVCKLCNPKHIFQLDVSIPNLNLLWWVEAQRLLKRNQHLWNGRSCNAFAISCSLASLLIQGAEHTRKKRHISCFVDLGSHHFSSHWHLLGHWQPEWDVVVEFPSRSSWLCAEEQQQEGAEASASRFQCCKKEPQEWEPSLCHQLFSAWICTVMTFSKPL